MKKLLFAVLLICAAAFGSCGSAAGPSGNIGNYGYVLVDGNDIYYTKVIIGEMDYYGNIYKYNTVDQTEILVAETHVDYFSEMNAYLTLYNGYLYFLPYFLHDSVNESSPNIFRVIPDGKNTTPEPLLTYEASITFMQITGGKLYFYDDFDEMLYSMNPDGTNHKIICEDIMFGISISGNRAYYTDYEMLSSVNLYGGQPKLIFDFSELEDESIYLENIIVDGNYVYYLSDDFSHIGRIGTNGRNKKNIYTAELNEYICFFNISGDTLFVVSEDYGEEENYAVIAVNIKDGSAREVVSASENLGDILPLSIWGETIYFTGMPIYETIMDSDYVWFTVQKDGGSLAAWQPFNVVLEDWEAEYNWDFEYDYDDEEDFEDFEDFEEDDYDEEDRDFDDD